MLALQCRRLALLPTDAPLGGARSAQTYAGRASNWAGACAAWFQAYRVGAAALVTGYFQPVLHDALHSGGIYWTPVLARPGDLVGSGAPMPKAGQGLGGP